MFVTSANQETGLLEPLSDWWRGEGFPSGRPSSPFLTSQALLQLGPSQTVPIRSHNKLGTLASCTPLEGEAIYYWL